MVWLRRWMVKAKWLMAGSESKGKGKGEGRCGK